MLTPSLPFAPRDEEENNLLTCVSIALANKSLTLLEPPRGLSAESVIKMLVCISPVHSTSLAPVYFC